MNYDEPVDKLVTDLIERAKELNCLYKVQELLNNPKLSTEKVCAEIIRAIPPGWQYPDVCHARITLGEKQYCDDNFIESEWLQSAPVILQDEQIGSIDVFYTEERPPADEGPFLKEERKLIDTIAEQLGFFLLHRRLKSVFAQKQKIEKEGRREWNVVVDLLKRTDQKLLLRVSRKMINYLNWAGLPNADALLEKINPVYREAGNLLRESNQPFQKLDGSDLLTMTDEIFQLAEKHLSGNEIVDLIQKWIKEDRSGFLVNALEDSGTSLAEISNALERYHHLAPQGLELSEAREMSIRVALINRMLSSQHAFGSIARDFISVDDFNSIVQRVIYHTNSHGKLGGKSSGMILAEQILRKFQAENDLFKDIRTPKTWYVASDGILNFISYNNLEDIIELKYKDIGIVRQEYPYVVQVFKNSPFPPDMVRGLSQALDDFGEVPLIIRSSSLLEDRMGAAFAGKYKSLFIANQGNKGKRLTELMDAIAEVYASTFGPDPIEYRAGQGLLDYHEEMGIMIQEVVGKKVGPYFFPAFAGVAFSRNEFRWSSRINQDDGLLRMVPGLGTRAVDRLSDDYPVLIAPGQPKLRVNVSIDEIVRYSPKYVDVINLDSESFETIELKQLLRRHGAEFPANNQIFSTVEEDRIRMLSPFGADFEKDFHVVTFENLIRQTPFVQLIREMLNTLAEKYERPVDIEFAHNGEHFYLLQCRSQSSSMSSTPAEIPNVDDSNKIIFSAARFVTNGMVSNITHIVYVDPQKYSEISDYKSLKTVGRAVGMLNKLLPKRQFILMGPGRWGSRGDIKLGVSVTYSEINNTAMLIEIARKQKDYVPDLSFGTHFFQDLVEAGIKYLPLYPDDEGIIFNEAFLQQSHNLFPEMLPEFADMQDTIRVIDVSTETPEETLQVYMNGEQDKALALLGSAQGISARQPEPVEQPAENSDEEFHWRWRLQAAESIGKALDPGQFGVEALYIFGSTKNATARANSDIDLLIHFTGNENQRRDLENWLDGWSRSLSTMNFIRSGEKSDGLLDVHFVTDEDIRKKTSYAAKIGAVTDAARPLPLKGR